MNRQIGKILTYEPIEWQKSLGYRFNPAVCAATVFGERVTIYQCQRKPSIKFKGFGFCKQHAKMAGFISGTASARVATDDVD
jgi:hypothetical protein